MRKLSETIARLRALNQVLGASRSSPPPRSNPPPGRLKALRYFGTNPGQLNGWIFEPEGLPRGSPLVVVLHGCTQSAASYDYGSGWSRLAETGQFAVLFPEQQSANNMNRCFNWFLQADTSRNHGEALSIYGMIDEVVTTRFIDPRRIYITGLSAGGAMATAMLATYPEIFAGGAIIAGLPFGVAASVPEAFDRMRTASRELAPHLSARVRAASPHEGPWPKVSIWHGDADRVVHPSNAEMVLSQWLPLHGADRKPDATWRTSKYLHRVWQVNGVDVVQDYQIFGMGHGTPIDQASLGKAGPFMLNVGVNSSALIAQSWGLVDEWNASADARNGPNSMADEEVVDMSLASTLSERDAVVDTQGLSKRVKKTIEDALRSAGLMN